MTGTAGALASGLATRFVAFDEGAPQKMIEGWEVAQ
jgi:hypothetical protein